MYAYMYARINECMPVKKQAYMHATKPRQPELCIHVRAAAVSQDVRASAHIKFYWQYQITMLIVCVYIYILYNV